MTHTVAAMSTTAFACPPVPTPSCGRRALATAALGCAGALGYGALKTAWALGSHIGVEGTPAWERDPLPLGAELLAFAGTALLALLAVAILLALVMPAGRRVPRRPLRALAWTGAGVMIPFGLVGVATSLPGVLSEVPAAELDGMYPATFLFVYGSFLLLGIGFAATAWLTRASREVGAAAR